MTSRIFKPWLVLALIFLAGIATGSILTIGIGPHFMHPPRAEEMKNHWMIRLTQKLNLTADQQAKIQPIVTDEVNQIQSLHRDEMDRGSKIMAAVDQQISAILTPDQKTELEKMENEREHEFSGHMHSWRGGGHGGPDGSPPPEH